MSELQELMKDERFQNLLGKAETHEWEFRPKEAARLEPEGKLEELLLLRTRECWESLKACRRSGMRMNEAEEIALPLILVPDENEEPDTERGLVQAEQPPRLSRENYAEKFKRHALEALDEAAKQASEQELEPRSKNVSKLTADDRISAGAAATRTIEDHVR